MSEGAVRQTIVTTTPGTEADNCRRALEDFSWYVQIAREMHARYRELVEAAELPVPFQSALEGTGGSAQIASAIARWEQLLVSSEQLPAQWRTEMQLVQNASYRGTLGITNALARSLRVALAHEEDLRTRLVREWRQESQAVEEDLSHWLSGEEARASLEAAIKVAAHCQATGRYGTAAEAKEVLTPEEFGSYSAMIRRLCEEGEKA